MSGALCPECGEPWLTGDPGGKGKLPMFCQVCEWRGDGGALPRKIMAPSDEPSKYELRKAGKLFFVRIECARVPSDKLISGIMDTLQVHSLSTGSRHLLVELEAKPPEDRVAALRDLAGIVKVQVV